MRTLLLTMVMLSFLSCKTKQPNKATFSKFSIIDSLDKYGEADSLFKFNNLPVYAGIANQLKFGLVGTTDTSFVVYQKRNNMWNITDTFNSPLFYVFKPQDLNGDQYDDLIITYAASGNGNGQNICLLFNPIKKTFYHNKHFDLPNINYDKKKNLVISSWWASPNNPQQKMTYRIVGDSLNFDQGLIFIPPAVENGIAVVELYTMKAGVKHIQNKIAGTYDDMRASFDKQLWDTGNNW